MRRLVKWLTNILLGLLVLLVVVFIVLPVVFSSRLAIVYTGSMAPAMSVGDLAWMQPVDPSKIKVGDIVAFNPPSQPDVTVSHRVIEIIREPALGFQTKGDANEDPDFDIIPADNVLAKVPFTMPNMGRYLLHIKQYTKSRLGFGLFIALPTVLLIGSAMRDMNFMLRPGARRARQRQKRAQRLEKRWGQARARRTLHTGSGLLALLR